MIIFSINHNVGQASRLSRVGEADAQIALTRSLPEQERRLPYVVASHELHKDACHHSTLSPLPLSLT